MQLRERTRKLTNDCAHLVGVIVLLLFSALEKIYLSKGLKAAHQPSTTFLPKPFSGCLSFSRALASTYTLASQIPRLELKSFLLG